MGGDDLPVFILNVKHGLSELGLEDILEGLFFYSALIDQFFHLFDSLLLFSLQLANLSISTSYILIFTVQVTI